MRCFEEYRAISFENIWASNERKLRNWIKDIQSEINSLRKKCINFDEIFSLLVKIMKKVESSVNLVGINFT